MGCGVVSKDVVNSVNTKTELSILKRSRSKGSIFVEDLDDINNVVATKRNSVHFDIVKTADSMLKSATTNQEKANIYAMKADHYFRFACVLQGKADFDYFSVFRKSQMNYTLANTLDPLNINSMLGQAKCLLKLNQNQKAFSYLQRLTKNKAIVEIDEFWLLYGMSSRKCAAIWNDKSKLEKKPENLKKARECFAKVNSHADIQKENQILDNLVAIKSKYNSDILNYMTHLKENVASYKLTATRQNKEKQTFKILSIDGGGLRGVLSGQILSEVEKRCKCYLTDIFDYFAGVSTGGILAAACTVPERIGSLKPKHSVTEIIEFYLENGQTIFPDTCILNTIFSQKYSNQFLYGVMQSKFGNIRLSQTLSSLLIPAVNCDGPIRTEYFTNYDARRVLEKDLYVVDVIMATTAAPSFFKPYKIKGLGSFLDGCIITNSPAKKAYEEALCRFNKQKDEIYILSLGTGVESTALFANNFSVSKSFLDWTVSIPNYIMTAQAHNTDKYLRSQLNDRYRRLQFYFENSIPMDDHMYLPDLLDIGTEYIEENNDEINKIIEQLLE
jgi:patatin-like phospholipase/acyl hydrolase